MKHANVWKVGMKYVDIDFMINKNLAYAFGDSMPSYLGSIGNVKENDIVFLAVSVQRGIHKVGIVSSRSYYCNIDKIPEEKYLDCGITKSNNSQLKNHFKKTNETDLVYFHVNWLNINTSTLNVNFNNVYGFTRVLDDKNIKDYMVKILNMNKYIELIDKNKNIILTGAPGTGKTFLAREIAKSIVSDNLRNEFSNDIFTNTPCEPENEEELLEVETHWQYWRERILSTDFAVTEYTYQLEKIEDQELKNKGGYLMNFLERTSSEIYGSSKPGNAFYYGLKYNNDNEYTYRSELNTRLVDKVEANEIFQCTIKPYLQNIITSSLIEKAILVEKGHEIIKAKQLLRKIVVLEHPADFLTIYQTEAVENAHKYYLQSSSEKNFLLQSKALIDYFCDTYELERNKDTQFRVTSFIWKYFNRKSTVDIDKSNTEIQINIENQFIDEFIEFVQFHPSYDYSDFIEGLRPIKKGEILGFELRNGIFKAFCKRALNNPTKKYVFIIDEINRGDISKIFGELFFSIDPGYRGIDGKVKTQYANIQTEVTIFSEEHEPGDFFIPENVYIIGTMNDIDRSVESFDFAMRRRFTWVEITPESRISMWDSCEKFNKDEATKKINALNNVICDTEELGSHFQIGPAYFLKLEDHDGDYTKLWQYHIEPLLKEYLRGTSDINGSLKKMKEAYGAN